MTILLTGVSKGLGLAIARTLLESGHLLLGISRTEPIEIIELKKEFPNNFELLIYDLDNLHNIQKFIFKEFIKKRKIDVFINNAAWAYDDIVTNAQIEPLEKMYRINVLSPIIITKYTIRNILLFRGQGAIIHISSISVHTGYKGLSMYASTKGALEAFSKNTAREWGEMGIKSNCIVAGFMDTEMTRTLSIEQKERIYKRTSQKKPVDPLSIAKTIEHLIGPGGNSITGQNIFIDSGTI
jgi:3-oxoacyl-[acyl-carrier protein] reductase